MFFYVLFFWTRSPLKLPRSRFPSFGLKKGLILFSKKGGLTSFLEMALTLLVFTPEQNLSYAWNFSLFFPKMIVLKILFKNCLQRY